MKRAVICLILCAVFLLLVSGCAKEPSDALSSEEAAIRAITDDAVMEKYALADLEDFRIHAYKAPNGNSYACYTLQLCGYYANDMIKVELDADGTITNITDSFGKYSVFIDRVNAADIWWAKFRMLGSRIRYFDEEKYAYYLNMDQEGNLYLTLEIIDHFENSEADESQEALNGCGFDHEHLFFSKVICQAPE